MKNTQMALRRNRLGKLFEDIDNVVYEFVPVRRQQNGYIFTLFNPPPVCNFLLLTYNLLFFGFTISDTIAGFMSSNTSNVVS